jgi:hypothetical protein
VPVQSREVAGVMVDTLEVVVAAVTDMSASMNARLLEASRRPTRGVDPGVKEGAVTVALTSNTPIWDLVPVPKMFVFIPFHFWRLI